MKILVGGIGQETNMFSKRPVTYDDFKKNRGEMIRQHTPTVSLFEAEGWDVILNLHAYTIPSGPLSKAEYLKFIEDFFAGIQDVDTVDGIYLILHGAMYVEGIGSGEEYLIRELRKKYGDHVPIAASFDFHGNMKKEVLDRLNYATAYRTAPHVDELETRTRAIKALIRCVKEQKLPKVKMIKLPIMLPGEKVITADYPCNAIIPQLEFYIDGSDVWDVSLVCGFAWADHDYMTMSIIVSCLDGTDTQEQLLNEANRVWSLRDAFQYSGEAYEPEEAVERADESAEGIVFISDSGDNITAGSAGDDCLMLELAVKKQLSSSLVVGIADAQLCELCRKHSIGDQISTTVGGTLDRDSRQISISGKILDQGFYTDNEDTWYVLLDIDGVHALFFSKRYAVTCPEDFARAKIRMDDYRVIIIKLGYLYPELEPISKRSILALTPGNAYQKIECIQFSNSAKFYPKDEILYEAHYE